MLEMKMELDALLPGQRPNSKDQRLETREPETRDLLLGRRQVSPSWHRDTLGTPLNGQLTASKCLWNS